MTGKRILYIEDNSDNRLLIKRVLEAEGYTVLEAETGLKGLELAASNQLDLILMDINLPEVDGYECTHRLRKVPGGDKIPIIALTANAMEGDAQKALDAGCNGYIPKPIDVDHLPSQIEKHMRKPVAEAPQAASVQPRSSQPSLPPKPALQPSMSPGVASPAPGSSGSGAPAPSSPSPNIPASSSPSPSAPVPSSPSPNAPVPGAPASPQPVGSPSLAPQAPGAQGQDSQAQNAQPQNVQAPNPQDRGSHN